MDQRPEQPPEGKLIEDAAKDLDISIREAARRAGLSYGRWRQIVKGYQNVSPGVYAEVRNAPAKTVARMAKVVSISAERMGTEGGRPDVAEELRRSSPAPVPPPLPPAGLAPALQVSSETALTPFVADVTRDLWRAIGMDPGPGDPPPIPDEILERIDAIPAGDLFPDNGDRQAWEIRHFTVRHRIRLVAVLRRYAAGAMGGGERNISSG